MSSNYLKIFDYITRFHFHEENGTIINSVMYKTTIKIESLSNDGETRNKEKKKKKEER